jgi:hypothetical protein
MNSKKKRCTDVCSKNNLEGELFFFTLKGQYKERRGSYLNRYGLTQHGCSCMGRIGRAAAGLALEGGEEVLTQLLRDVVFEIGGHEELEALIVDGLRRERKPNPDM